MIMKYSPLLFLMLTINFSAFAQPNIYQDSLHLQLSQLSTQSEIPGFGTIIIRDGAVKYAKGFGYENSAEKKPYTTSSIQNIASLSKTVIGVSLMKCVQLGLLQLDDPINKYLPYSIVNPHSPNALITVRHLATHTSTLNDPNDYERAYIFQSKIETGKEKIPKGYKKYIKLYNKNTRVPLDEFVQSIFIAGGKYYRTKNFLKAMPGKQFKYSNIGAGIASRIVEIVSKMSFQDFTAKHIFEPLGMNDTGWDLTTEVLTKKVTPYLTPSLPLPHYDLVTFADGGLITSLDDFSKYMMEMMRCYNGEGEILSKALCQEMMTPHLNEGQLYGIFWEISASKKSIGHNGGDPGTLTNCYFQPATGVAKIMFSNMLPHDKKSNLTFNAIWKTLRKYELKVN